MSHLQFDRFFLLSKVNHTISNAIAIVIYEISYNKYKIEVKLIPLCNSVKILLLLYIEYKSTGHYNHGRNPQSWS